MLIDGSVSGSSENNGDSSRSIVDPGDSPPSHPARDETFFAPSDSNSMMSTKTSGQSTGGSSSSHRSHSSQSSEASSIIAHDHTATSVNNSMSTEYSLLPKSTQYNASATSTTSSSATAIMFPADAQQPQQPYFPSNNFTEYRPYVKRPRHLPLTQQEVRTTTAEQQQFVSSDNDSTASSSQVSSSLYSHYYQAKRPRVCGSDRIVTNDSETSCRTAMSPTALSPLSHSSVVLISPISDKTMATAVSHPPFFPTHPRKPSSASSLGTTTMSVASAEYSTTKSVYSYADSSIDTVKASNLASRYARGVGSSAGHAAAGVVAPQPRMLHHPSCVEENDEEDDDEEASSDVYDDENGFETDEEANWYTSELLRQMASMRAATREDSDESSSFGIWYRQQRGKQRVQYSDRCQGSVGLSMAILIFVIGLMVLASGYSKKSKSYSYGNAQETTPRQRATINILHLHGISDMMDLTTPGTPQYQAAQWIGDYDPLQYPIPSSPSDRAPRTIIPSRASADLTLTQYKFIQRYVLTVLFFSLGGGHDSWDSEVNFLSAQDECEWFQFKVLDHHSYRLGISCQDLMHVDAIRLADNHIVGSLPSELQHLYDLQELDLQKNAITGTIPSGLNNLITLDLSHNDLTGMLPTALQSMTGLEHLDLGHNSYQGTIPSKMGHMVNLEFLNLQNNFFTGSIPQEVWDLPAMTECILSENQLDGSIPITIANAANLNVLALHSNGLTGESNSLCEKSTSLSIMTVDCDDVQCSNVCCSTCCTAQDEAKSLCEVTSVKNGDHER